MPEAEVPRRPRLLWDGKLRALGLGITGVSKVYGAGIAILTFIIELGILSDVAGFWGLVVGVSIAPVTFAVAPLYAGFRQSNWMPAFLCYGGMVTMYLNVAFGALVSDED